MSSFWKRRALRLVCAVAMAVVCGCSELPGRLVPFVEGPWDRHTIDDGSRGADGVRLADANGDGWPDVVTGWEEGGRIRLCLNPGPERAGEPWPAVTVGQVGAPEDAVLVDLDGDGRLDVVSSSEGDTRTVWVHWAPANEADLLKSDAWTTDAIPATKDLARWMFCLPMQVDGRRGIDLIVGAKNSGAQVGWLESPADPRDLQAWKFHPLEPVGWVMSLLAEDMDGDGDADLVVTDRKGETRGCFWLENPGLGDVLKTSWVRHAVGGEDRPVMFAVLTDLDGDGVTDILATTSEREMLYFRRDSLADATWETHIIALPEEAGTGKGLAVGDIDGDGQLDIVFSCEHAEDRIGVMWMSYRDEPTEPIWQSHDISGREGVKYDLVELIDLDDDGDLDVMTCEERTNLGVIWYENPN